MDRAQLEHVLAAAAQIVGEEEFVVIGSQAILASHPDAPAELLRSIEADVYPLHAPEKADAIDGALGDGSPFHQAFGYYAHGVGPTTATPPAGWRDRLVRIEVPPRPGSEIHAIAWCLEAHDLILAKCVAGRPRDWDFARDALAAGIVGLDLLAARVHDLPETGSQGDAISRQLRAFAARSRR